MRKFERRFMKIKLISNLLKNDPRSFILEK